MNFRETSREGDPSHLGAITPAAHLDDLRAAAQHARQRYDLYKAKAYSQRLTSPSRMRELERACAQADDAYRRPKARAQRPG
jgi:hypothetical protein